MNPCETNHDCQSKRKEKFFSEERFSKKAFVDPLAWIHQFTDDILESDVQKDHRLNDTTPFIKAFNNALGWLGEIEDSLDQKIADQKARAVEAEVLSQKELSKHNTTLQTVA